MESVEAQLTKAFRVFNTLSVRMEDSYRELEQRVEALTLELAEAQGERVRQLQEKERLAQRLTELLAALPGGVVVVDREGRIAEANTLARDLLGEPLEGQRWKAVTARAFIGEESSLREVRLHCGRWLNLSRRSLDGDGSKVFLLNDVTDTRDLQDRLARQQRLLAMGEMAATLAHQVRTPLSTAILYLSQLARPGRTGEQQAVTLERIRARLWRLERMVAGMLSFARGSFYGDEKLTVAALLVDVYQSVAPLVSGVGGRLEIDDRAGEAQLRAGRDMLAGAIVNLVQNSLEAGGEGVKIEVKTRVTGTGWLELRVTDDGPGVPPDVADRIFEPFFTTRSQGTGLGLALVHAVMEAHGGEVQFAPASRRGACFLARLPLDADAGAGRSGAETRSQRRMPDEN